MDIQRYCEYDKCINIATGKCDGRQSCNFCLNDEQYPFTNDCDKYFCKDHLTWGWGVLCVNGCVSSPQCPKHHTGIKCCIIL
jgi:hypothetical protein